MRVLFHDPANPAEAAEYANLVRRIDDFWGAFSENHERVRDSFRRDANREWLAPFMIEHLNKVHQGIMWEFGPACHGEGHRLVLTPEHQTALRPMIDLLLERQPSLPGWEFYPYRLPEDARMVGPTLEGRVPGADLAGARALVTLGKHRRIDLLFEASHFDGPEDKTALNAAFVAVETLLGEELLDKWVGAIGVEPLKKSGMFGKLFGGARQREGVPLERLNDTFRAVMESNREQLSPQPREGMHEGATCSLLELPPDENRSAEPWSDMFLALTTDVPLWQATHSGLPFYSERFSRCGETFAYLKIDAGHVPLENRSQDRGRIEEALQLALHQAGKGAVIGGGTGPGYAYVDLALLDLPGAVTLIRPVLQQLKLPLETWLLFFDAHLADEWAGAYPQTPAPEMKRTQE